MDKEVQCTEIKQLANFKEADMHICMHPCIYVRMYLGMHTL